MITHGTAEGGGAGVRLMAHIALNSSPDEPWTEIPTRTAASMFAAPGRGAGSKLVTRLAEKGLLVEAEGRTNHLDPRLVRLTLDCNVLCAPGGGHVPDVLTRDLLERLEAAPEAVTATVERLNAEDPTLGETYRRLLADVARPAQALRSSPVDVPRNGLTLLARGLIREHNSTSTPHYLPVAEVLNDAGGDR